MYKCVIMGIRVNLGKKRKQIIYIELLSIKIMIVSLLAKIDADSVMGYTNIH